MIFNEVIHARKTIPKRVFRSTDSKMTKFNILESSFQSIFFLRKVKAIFLHFVSTARDLHCEIFAQKADLYVRGGRKKSNRSGTPFMKIIQSDYLRILYEYIIYIHIIYILHIFCVNCSFIYLHSFDSKRYYLMTKTLMLQFLPPAPTCLIIKFSLPNSFSAVGEQIHIYT